VGEDFRLSAGMMRVFCEAEGAPLCPRYSTLLCDKNCDTRVFADHY
jgi:hypothetical protein